MAQLRGLFLAHQSPIGQQDTGDNHFHSFRDLESPKFCHFQFLASNVTQREERSCRHPKRRKKKRESSGSHRGFYGTDTEMEYITYLSLVITQSHGHTPLEGMLGEIVWLCTIRKETEVWQIATLCSVGNHVT